MRTDGRVTRLLLGPEWRDIVAVEASREYNYGLRNDGAIVSSETRNKVGDLIDIAAFSVGRWAYGLVAIKTDGQIVTRGFNKNQENEISLWKNIGFAGTVTDQKRMQRKQWEAESRCLICGGKISGFFERKLQILRCSSSKMKR